MIFLKLKDLQLHLVTVEEELFDGHYYPTGYPNTEGAILLSSTLTEIYLLADVAFDGATYYFPNVDNKLVHVKKTFGDDGLSMQHIIDDPVPLTLEDLIS